ncbi:MAG: Uma2 family endonuclease [Leptolyngbya sp. SIO1D8]|nr:Uma2 family endonuclease [Leptolyngbya sp. SIO1D8]
MTTSPFHIPQTEPPRSPRETLPTMYDLPSEDPAKPGLPDEFHDHQPALLSLILRLADYADDNFFTGKDLNFYYDVRHSWWYKRPDWFLSVGVPRLYDNQDMRLSYVVWQEGVNPFVVVELLSPGTHREDLGETEPQPDTPPDKWTVYEKILRVPYYIVFDRYTDDFRAFKLNAGRYEALNLSEGRLWLPELNIGLGLWQGRYKQIERLWLRWYDETGNWFLPPSEQVTQEQQRTAREQQRADDAESELTKLKNLLQAKGINPDEL